MTCPRGRFFFFKKGIVWFCTVDTSRNYTWVGPTYTWVCKWYVGKEGAKIKKIYVLGLSVVGVCVHLSHQGLPGLTLGRA